MVSTAESFKELWARACAERGPERGQFARAIVNSVADLLEVEPIDFSDAADSQAPLFLLDLSPLGLSQMSTNVLMVAHVPTSQDEEREQAKLLTQYKDVVQSVGFCFQILLAQKLPPRNSYIPSSIDPVFISGDDLFRMFSAEVPRAAFYDIIRRQVKLENLCPFGITHEARGAMFKGRRVELNRLVNHAHTNFVVTGARRIGKTSLLRRAYESLRIQREFRERSHYFNCITWGSYLDCAHRVAHTVAPKREMRIDRGLRNLVYLLERESAQQGRPLLLFFDEMDNVVDTDFAADWPFFKVLADAAAAGWVRVVLAGYRSMGRLTLGKMAGYSDGGRMQSPLLGALDPIELTPLRRIDTLELVVDPFRAVDIPIRQPDQVAERLWQNTAGYPFFVQFFGERLFIAATDRDRPEVRLEDVEAIEKSFELNDFLVTSFLENTMDHGNPVAAERLCAFLLSRDDAAHWTEGEFVAACREQGYDYDITEVHDALRNLYSAKVVKYEGSRYSFALPMLRETLRNSFPDLSSILSAVEKK